MAKTTKGIVGAPDLVTAKVIAAALNVCTKTVYRLKKRGMPTTRWLGHLAAYSHQILAWQKAEAETSRAA